MPKSLGPGDEFGNLTILRWNKGKGKWDCICKCGSKVLALTTSLLTGRHKQCLSCRTRNKVSLSPGDKFGKLTVLAWNGDIKSWICKCDCGEMTKSRSYSLKAGRHRQCGECYKNSPRLNSRLPNNMGPKRECFNNYKRAAKKRGYEFGISFENFVKIIESDCHYCGLAPSQSSYGQTRGFRRVLINGVDRVDNNLGYIASNAVAACSICNNSKASLPMDEWKSWIERVHKHQFGK